MALGPAAQLQSRLVHGLLQRALADDDEGGLPVVDDLPELLDIGPGHATPQMAARPAHRSTDGGTGDDRGREQDGARLVRLEAAKVGVAIECSGRPPGAGGPMLPMQPGFHPGAAPPPRRWHRRGPGEMQVAMTEPAGVRVTRPLAAYPRGFCAPLAALGRF